MKILFLITVVVVLFLYDTQALKAIFQRTNITYLNEKYIKWATLTIKRYVRRGDYYVNLDGEKYHTWGNNITLHIIFYEYLHNEYRRSFIEMHFRLCDMVNNDPFLGIVFKNIVKCPVVEKEVHFKNLSLPLKDFPYKFPFTKSRVDLQAAITATKEVVGEGNAHILFEE